MPTIRSAIQGTNPWWKEKFEVDFKYREIYRTLQKFMRMPQIIALTGLRRTGKTTLMRKIIYDHIRSGLDSKDILYFSFDDFAAAELDDIVSAYEELVGGSLKSGRHLLLFDEIQKLDNWQEKLKRLYDANYGKAKIIISGSESLFIRKMSRESLAGRIFEFEVSRLAFKEFLSFKGDKVEPVGVYEKELAGLFEEYTKTGGFPELIGIKDNEVIRKYMKENVVDKILYGDIPKVFENSDPQVLESILNMLMDNPGQIINVLDLSKEIGVERHICSRYLSHLEAAFLVKKLYNFSKNRRKVERKLKRYYPALVSAELLLADDVLSKSKVFEWSIVTQLSPAFFWRDAYKNEVDVVLSKNKEILPIEIKYGGIDLHGLLAFMNKFSVSEGYVISKKEEGIRKSGSNVVKITPAFKFLLDTKKYAGF